MTHGPDHGPTPEDEPRTTPDQISPAPVEQHDRIRSLDVLRGVAVLGILLVNVWAYGLVFPASTSPRYVGANTPLDQAVALIVLAARRGWLGALEPRLAAAGRMAFTNYIAQTLICVTIFFGFGLGRFHTMNRLELLGVAVAIWVLELWWSPWWLDRFRFGPLEWAWRSLTYHRLQPMRRARAAMAVA